ncbi:MAG: MinD/ParA family protein [Nitrospirales bacterium]|nr:MinD/ParA family protein [Nitrospiraceae bacterium]MDR4486271.1 MinD/ParA family protein [Nitrospirales bacterium]
MNGQGAVIMPTLHGSRPDQATGLRQAMNPPALGPMSKVQVVAVSSGKGGVGKTNVVVNLAVASARQGRKVLVMDADLALGNVDIVLGVTPKYTIEDVLSGHQRLSQVLTPGPAGIHILPATSGGQEFSHLNYEQQLHLQSAFLQLPDPPDLLCIDCAAGISANVLYFSLVAHETLIVVTPDPSSLTDAYALVKILSTRYHLRSFRLLINRAKNVQEGKEVFRKFSLVTDRFLTLRLDYVGCIPLDDYIGMAVTQQRAVCDLYPRAPSSRAFHTLATHVHQWTGDPSWQGGFQLFGPAAMAATQTVMEG